MASGAWILLDITPEQLASIGIPKKGDAVVIEYDETGQPHYGVAKVLGSATNNNKDGYRAQEDGADFIFSANFGSQ